MHLLANTLINALVKQLVKLFSEFTPNMTTKMLPPSPIK